MSEWKGASLDKIIHYGFVGKDTSIVIKHSILKEASEPDFLWADNVKYGSYTPLKYNPEGEVQLEINISNGAIIEIDKGFKRSTQPKDVEIYLNCSQEDFITLVRYLNNMKNKLLKLRREYDERNVDCFGNEKGSRG